MLESTYDPQGKATDIFKYVDDKVSGGSDPSAAISAHNKDTSAHSDIRTAVSNAAAAAANAQTTANSKEASGTAAAAVSAHNTSSTAHSDIREIAAAAMAKATYDPNNIGKDVYKYAEDEAATRLSKTGDTLTGLLTIKAAEGAGYSRIFKNATATNDYGFKMQDQDANGNFIGFTLSASLQGLEFQKKRAGDADYHYTSLYDSDNPPSADDVGALPISGGTLSGELTVDSEWGKVTIDAGSGTTQLVKNGSATEDYGTLLKDTHGDDSLTLKLRASTGNARIIKGGIEYEIYHEGFAPTPTDIGAATTQTYTVDVPTGWTSGAEFSTTVAVADILATDNPIADIVTGSDVDANAAYLAAWGAVTRITTADGSITLYASAEPSTAFTVQLKVVR
jgi:hypothetical protein